MFLERCSGILLHITSLPGKFGIGSLGKEAYEFIDFLIKAKQKIWQVYPLGPTSFGDSPYQCFSAFAGNPYLIDLELLNKDGYLSKDDLKISDNQFDDNRVDYGKVIEFKVKLLKTSYNNFKKKANDLEKAKIEIFKKNNSFWINDFALFMALKDKFGGKPWFEWDNDIKLRKPEALKKYKEELKDEINYNIYLQYIFFKQWLDVKNYANRNFIKIIGDIPLYIAYDSSDAWTYPENFLFDENRVPIKVAGVPPDYFSATGQLWGNPLYNWEYMKEHNFKWWLERIKINLILADIIRIDHFRGLSAYWAVPYGNKTAEFGQWEKALGRELFETVQKEMGSLPIIAEDLGVITPDVEKLRDDFNFPGMKILQFAFDSDEDSNNGFLPHNYVKNSIVYTGTHDNDTVVGWFQKAKKGDQQFAKNYLNNINPKTIHWDFIKAAWSSVSVCAIAPLQDILGLGSEARQNTPGVSSGNWQWRYNKSALNKNIIEKLKKLTEIYKR